MEERRRASNTMVLCRCGFMAVGENFNAVNAMQEEHKAGREGHEDERYIPVNNPVPPEMVADFRRVCSITSTNSQAADYIAFGIGGDCEGLRRMRRTVVPNRPVWKLAWWALDFFMGKTGHPHYEGDR